MKNSQKHPSIPFCNYLLPIKAALFVIYTISLGGCGINLNGKKIDLAYSNINPQTIQLDLPNQKEPNFNVRKNGIGGLITADVNNDEQRDFIITKPGGIEVYEHSGKQLWSKDIDIQLSAKSESQGLPGLHASGVQAADVDGDGKAEVLFLTKDNTVHILEGVNGETEQTIELPSPEGSERWEHLVIANFRGKGDRDLLVQSTSAEGYRMGRYLAAYPLDNPVKGESPQPLWTRNDFLANAHNGARVADLNGDGKDEVLGGTIVSSQGKVLFRLPLKLDKNNHHLDSVFVADVRPDIPGLEVVALEEGGDNRVFLYNRDRLIWQTNYKRQEPQNAAVGDFDPTRPGLEIWCRSRYNENQKPFIFDARGKLIADYQMKKVAPPNWTERGVELIFTIDWTGDSKQLAAAKERHKPGDVAIFDPLSGEFLYLFQEKAERLYVADVSGDWREELIVLSDGQLNIYSNSEPNPNPDQPRLWSQNYYRRSKMTWNYYSP